MSITRRHRSAFPLLYLVAVLARLAVAQDSTNGSSTLPPVPVAKSPVDIFRELLAMDPAAQRTALTNRPEASRQALTRKIREYQAMDPDERELRLVATELRWYLPQLMAMSGTNRSERLADIRPNLRALIESRLERWDKLPAALRERGLQNERAFALLLQIRSASGPLREMLVSEVSPELRETLDRALARLDAMSPAERKRAFDVFENVFTMTEAEKKKVMGVISDAERKQMEETLATFGGLTSEQRKRCIRSFERFVGMTPAERMLFYRNVQEWEKMSPKERQEWRELVRNVELLPPVTPPQVSPPPLPPTNSPPRITPRIMTNQV